MIAAIDLFYQHATREWPALQGVNLSIAKGEVVLLTGDSGSGKSTLLMALAGLLNDDEDGELRGRVRIDGTVGMVLQDPDSQVIAARVGDDVAFGAENLGVEREEIWRRVPAALDLVGLDLDLDYPTARLSGGQKQRLALAGVLAMGADVLLLDEPTANLDPVGRALLVEAVQTVVARGVTVIIAEHRAHHWLALRPTIYKLSLGHLFPQASLPAPPTVPAARPASAQALVTATGLRTRAGGPLDFHLPAGSSTVIMGPNGSGKSTLAATIGGLLPVVSGRLELSETLRRGLGPDPVRWRSSQLAARIGHVFQDPEHQFTFRTVAEEVGGDEELLRRLRLDKLADKNPFTLSGGEKRRLSVASALTGTPELLILDEPTFGQDDAGFLELLDLIRDMVDTGRTVVSITHDELYRRALGDHEVEISA